MVDGYAPSLVRFLAAGCRLLVLLFPGFHTVMGELSGGCIRLAEKNRSSFPAAAAGCYISGDSIVSFGVAS